MSTDATENTEFDPAQVPAAAEAALALLEAVVADRGLLAALPEERRKALLIACGRVSRPDGDARNRLRKALERGRRQERKKALVAQREQSGIRKLRQNPLFQTPRRQRQFGLLPAPEQVELDNARVCYVCRTPYTALHFFYDQMCCSCGDFNYGKRQPAADLRGRVALVTGARVKIGYQAAIMLLRNGCHVIVTTRFPIDAARRYAAEEDAAEWHDRLEIHGIDLRQPQRVEELCSRIAQRHERLDYIINNACQTVRRPPGFYRHLMEAELAGAAGLAPEQRRLLGQGVAEAAVVRAREVLDGDGASPAAAALLSQIPLLAEDHEGGEALFPTGRLDADAQQVDLREMNSWRLKMAEVPTVELLEVHLVNAVAPFLLNARLKPLMKLPTRDAHIVNVSAMEGQFYRTFKSDRHPHTNMAKASLNMMTRTAALDYIDDGIHMNSVDTGWVTDEDPAAIAEAKKAEHDFSPPLDIVDGAARIVDPIFHGVQTGAHIWGQFLKDYKITDW